MKHAEDAIKAFSLTMPKGQRTIPFDAFGMWYYNRYKHHPNQSVLLALKMFVEREK